MDGGSQSGLPAVRPHGPPGHQGGTAGAGHEWQVATRQLPVDHRQLRGAKRLALRHFPVSQGPILLGHQPLGRHAIDCPRLATTVPLPETWTARWVSWEKRLNERPVPAL